MSDVIVLDVGGTIFKTRRNTLIGLDYFDDLLQPKNQEPDGSYFIDREPKYFGKLLNICRTGIIMINHNDIDEDFNIKIEAEFYRMQSVLEYYDKRIQQTKRGRQMHINMFNKIKNRSRSRSKSRSRSRSKSRSRSRSKSRSRSRSKSRSRSRSKSRERYVERGRTSLNRYDNIERERRHSKSESRERGRTLNRYNNIERNRSHSRAKSKSKSKTRY